MKNKIKYIIICGCAVLLVALFCVNSCTEEPKEELTYIVDDELNYYSDYQMDSSESAWNTESKISDLVNSSLGEMNNIFSKQKVSIEDYGAKPHDEFKIDPKTYKFSEQDKSNETSISMENTKAIYKAICDVSEKGGGTVIVPAKNGQVFYTSAIHMKDNVNLYIETGAKLKFSINTSLFQGDFMKELYTNEVDDKGLTLTRYSGVELMNYSPLIYAYGKKNIAITGNGTLDGSASIGDGINADTYVWQQWAINRTINGETNTSSEYASKTKLFGDAQNNVPVAQRQYGESNNEDTSGANDGFLRPNFISPFNCQNVYISGLHIINSPMWDINPILCDSVLVENCNINSHLANNDGCVAECTSNMVIKNNTFNLSGDCVSIKSGRNADAHRVNRPSYNIVITNNNFIDGTESISIGSEISSGTKNIFSNGNIMDSPQFDAAYIFKTNYIRGGNIENVFYKNDKVKMIQSDKPVVMVDLSYNINSEVEMMSKSKARYKAYVPVFRNIHIQNLNVNEEKIPGHGGKYAFQINGFSRTEIADTAENKKELSDCYVTDFNIENSVIYGTQQAFDMNYVKGFNLNNVTINGTTNFDFIKNCKNITMTNCNFTNGKILRGIIEKNDNTTIKNCKF